MRTSPNTAGGDCSTYLPSVRAPSTPFFKSTRPSLPKPGADFPVVTSSARRYAPLPTNTRGCKPPDPGQYARPRSATGDASCFQSNSPVSGTSAYTPSGAVAYMTPPITTGTASDPGLPARKVQAGWRRSTLPVLICPREEYRIAPGSFPKEGQSVWAKAEPQSRSRAANRVTSPQIGRASC